MGRLPGAMFEFEHDRTLTRDPGQRIMLGVGEILPALGRSKAKSVPLHEGPRSPDLIGRWPIAGPLAGKEPVNSMLIAEKDKLGAARKAELVAQLKALEEGVEDGSSKVRHGDVFVLVFLFFIHIISYHRLTHSSYHSSGNS